MSEATPPKLQWPADFPGVHWIDEQEEQVAVDVIRHGCLFRYYGLKPPHYVDEFERAAREFYGAGHALAVNSGTGALSCAMTALGIGPGCEVIVPAFLWVATVGAVVQLGAIPVLGEIDESFNLDPTALEAKITPRTKLIVAIHMAGAPCDMDGIMRVADRKHIPVLEDCAQCNGGSYQGRKVGTIGRMGIFSLQLNKNMTCGEGGLIITDDDRLAERAIASHDMGMARRNGRLARPEDYALTWGQGRRMPELSGAVAGVQLRKLPAIIEHMRNSKRRIKAGLAGNPGLSFRKLADSAGDTGSSLIMILEQAEIAKLLLGRLRESGFGNAHRIADYGLHNYANIPALVNKTPLSAAGNPWSSRENRASVYDYHRGACPRSDGLFERSVLIPIPSRLTPEQEAEAVRLIRQMLNASSAAR
ncbi:MAG: DegT/DnrJ/EryC1/StrS family aminotransferase [Opitutae bacterium]|nr:DegT/DnrJ/EryC1/StrS family aminotransferase [Opitutae bacterium]